MPHISKKQQHIKKLAEAKKKAQNDSAKKNAEITTNQGPKYEKRPFQEIQPEILDEKTRSGSSQPRDRNEFTNQDFVLVFDSKSLRKLLLLLLCPGCKSQNCLSFLATSTQGMCTFYQVLVVSSVFSHILA